MVETERRRKDGGKGEERGEWNRKERREERVGWCH